MCVPVFAFYLMLRIIVEMNVCGKFLLLKDIVLRKDIENFEERKFSVIIVNIK